MTPAWKAPHRRKCKGPLNGPTATGNHCPEGFASYKYPGPAFEGLESAFGWRPDGEPKLNVIVRTRGGASIYSWT